MFSRRPGARFNRGRIATAVGGVSPVAPLAIVSSATPAFFFSGDVGITLGTGVAAWADQTINGRHAVQSTGTSQPLYEVSDADFGGRGSVAGDGVDDMLVAPWNPPAPGTTPTWFFLVMQQITYTAGEYVLGCLSGSAVLGIVQSAVSPQLRQFNTTGANANGGAAVGTPFRLEVLFSNSTSDYVKAGSTVVTGANSGNGDGNTLSLFSRAGAAFGNVKIACVGAWDALPTAPERAALDAWVAAYYGGGVVI